MDPVTEDLASLSLQSSLPRSTRPNPLPCPLIRRIVSFLGPLEYHLVAPLVCKQWHRCIRRRKHEGDVWVWNPRVVLVNLVLVPEAVRESDEDEDKGKPRVGVVGEEGNGASDEGSDGNTKDANTKDASRTTRTTRRRQKRLAKTLIERPAPLLHWTYLPKEIRDATQATVAGEGMVVQVGLESVPGDEAELREFLNGLLAMLMYRARAWRPTGIEPGSGENGTAATAVECGEGEACGDERRDVASAEDDKLGRLAVSEGGGEESYRHATPNISIVPYQFTLTPPPGVISPATLATYSQKVARLLSLFSPRVLEAHAPFLGALNDIPAMAASGAEWTTPVHHVRVCGVSGRERGMPDIKNIGRLKHLVCLEVEGDKGNTAQDPFVKNEGTDPLREETAVVNGNTPPIQLGIQHLLPLHATLRELHIDHRVPLPIAQHTDLCNVVMQLPNLSVLRVGYIVQQSETTPGGVAPATLAKLVCHHPGLWEVGALVGVDEAFWTAVKALRGENRQEKEKEQPLRILSISLNPTHTSLLTLFTSTLTQLAATLPHLHRICIDLNAAPATSITARDVLGVLKKAKGEWGGDNGSGGRRVMWKEVVVEQCELGVSDVAVWGKMNLEDGEGFKVRWKGVRQ
ncbi:uncharacterized protein EV422DRAFT_568657 [Fimicolochytrium jonesii]|uniref:uncharacterized protein n=1 Tax=Fimicolochytrium jonesii TaxID=1396493 RepID=UPI0022FE3009|nr:uncharacterized protein EV422DRAFT_568657 [Fimicolochytrium jonesii]KAI8819696.1 hypothetical protein EV422DRAFT_568657 [Fimicolochytrium jonesii]